jgi:hypothetical protein
MKTLNSRHLRELKRFEDYIKSLNSKERIFKRIYENKKKDDDDDDDRYALASYSEGGYTLTQKEIIDYFVAKGYLKKLNSKDKPLYKDNIEIQNYHDLLDTVHYLIDILEFEMIINNGEIKS